LSLTLNPACWVEARSAKPQTCERLLIFNIKQRQSVNPDAVETWIQELILGNQQEFRIYCFWAR